MSQTPKKKYIVDEYGNLPIAYLFKKLLEREKTLTVT